MLTGFISLLLLMITNDLSELFNNRKTSVLSFAVGVDAASYTSKTFNMLRFVFAPRTLLFYKKKIKILAWVCLSTGPIVPYTLNTTTLNSSVQLTGHVGQAAQSIIQINANQVATGGDDWTVRVWDMTNLSLINTYYGHTDNVRGLVALPGGLLASGSYDSTLRIWNMQSNQVSVIAVSNKVFKMMMHPISGYLVVAMANTIALYITTSMALYQSIATPGLNYTDMDIGLPSGDLMMVGTSTLDVYHMLLGSLTCTVSAPLPLYRIKLLPDNVTVAAGGSSSYLGLFNSSSCGNLSDSYAGHAGTVFFLEVTPDLLYLVSGAAGDTNLIVWVWSTMNLTIVNTLDNADPSLQSGAILQTPFTGSKRYYIYFNLNVGRQESSCNC
jgi:WD40 repeat protein